MIIRELRAGDLGAAYQINQAHVPALGAESPESFEKLFILSDLALALEVEGAVCGFCLILKPNRSYESPNYQYFQDRYEDFIYLDRVAISVEAQGRGYGRQLYAEVERRLSASYFTLEVNIDPPNEGSLRFHLREGFQVIAEEETRPGKVVALMLKSLT